MIRGRREGLNREAPQKENVCGLIVTYYPDEDVQRRIMRIVDQVEHVMIVDNTSGVAVRLILRELRQSKKIEVMENETNVGIASALNQGMQWAIRRGYAWALTLDQDSIPFDSMVDRFAEAYEEYKGRDRIAVIGSNYCDIGDDRQIRFGDDASKGRSCVEKTTVITSGCLVSVPVFRAIGPFRDEFFIDHVDHEYCLRALSRGFKVILTPRLAMRHTIGKRVEGRLCGRKVLITSHSAERYYYKSRNHVTITLEYLFKNPIWLAKLFCFKLRGIMLAVLCEEDRSAKVVSIFKGYRDGIRNHLKTRGACPRDTVV
ncbi:MAG: glycosyltransferase family 2 protein [Thermodesulfobacteriota bacterium]|nr:glycosyltransferase family 2 protein [Thermodesulfobacteriota bacterium]